MGRRRAHADADIGVRKRAASVVAVEPTRVLKIPVASYRATLQEFRAREAARRISFLQGVSACRGLRTSVRRGGYKGGRGMLFLQGVSACRGLRTSVKGWGLGFGVEGGGAYCSCRGVCVKGAAHGVVGVGVLL